MKPSYLKIHAGKNWHLQQKLYWKPKVEHGVKIECCNIIELAERWNIIHELFTENLSVLQFVVSSQVPFV